METTKEDLICEELEKRSEEKEKNSKLTKCSLRQKDTYLQHEREGKRQGEENSRSRAEAYISILFLSFPKQWLPSHETIELIKASAADISISARRNNTSLFLTLGLTLT